MSYQPRFDKGIYRDCKWCGGKGCLSCPAEADKEYKRQFPDGPVPMASITLDELDQAEISESTGGPGLLETHGGAAVFLQKILEMIKK